MFVAIIDNNDSSGTHQPDHLPKGRLYRKIQIDVNEAEGDRAQVVHIVGLDVSLYRGNSSNPIDGERALEAAEAHVNEGTFVSGRRFTSGPFLKE